MAVSGEGELYTCGASWWGDFIVNKSSTAQNDTMAMDWDYWSPVNLDGTVVGWGGYECPNPTGILGQVYISVDSSGGPTHGNVYLLASVERFSNPDPMDVMFARSTNGGLTWSDPIRVNDDDNFEEWQWFGTMSVAPDGRIDVVWLDTRDNPGTFMSVLYYAYSIDAGDTWSENYALSEAFDPHVGWPDQDKMGDYYEMFSDETSAHLAWAATFNSEQDVYYSRITPTFTTIKENPQNKSITLSQNFPNPFNGQTNIKYNLKDDGLVSLVVFDMMGKEVVTIVNEYKTKGNHTVLFDASNLEHGIYYYKLTFGSDQETKKLIIVD